MSAIQQMLLGVSGGIVGRDGFTYGVVVAADGHTWLDRNLGATQIATSGTDSASYGHLYQWGRYCDGHQIDSSGTTVTLSTTTNPGHGNFIKVNDGINNWRNTRDDSMWQGVNGIQNPCPVGFRLPTTAEWAALVAAESITDDATAFSSTLKLPLAGRRLWSTAAVTRGTLAIYWSSSYAGLGDSASACYMGAGPDTNRGRVRAEGLPIRAIKDY